MNRSLSYRRMSRSRDEEDPPELRCRMNISHGITSRIVCLFSWCGTCLARVHETIRDKLENFKWKVEKVWKDNRVVIRPWWETVLVLSCVIAVTLDPLFFYIPTINEEGKCLETDTKLRTVSLVFRSFTDIIFIFDILDQVYKATTLAETWRTLAADFLSILPAPQVLIVVLFYKSRDFGYLDNATILNAVLLFQYAPRIYRLNQSFDKLTRKKGTRLRVKIAFNFFQYILACHILGASWFFFSIQREMICWQQHCVKHNTCGKYVECKDNSSRNVKELAELCPMNPKDSTVFDFGIFTNPLGTSRRTEIKFWTKFSYSFWWGGGGGGGGGGGAKSKCAVTYMQAPVFKSMGLYVLSEISKKMEIEVYVENTLIVKMNEPLDRMVFITEGSMGIYTTSNTDSSPSVILQGSLEECIIYGHDQLLSWVFSPNVSLDCLPISKKTVKCHTKVEAFVLTASDLKAILCYMKIIEDSYSDEDVSDISHSIEGGSSSSLRSAAHIATAASRFQRRLRRKKFGLEFDPSSYKGL
ncbi:cyclic nucleotide-gated ion channel 1-like [Argentina anserina]|uniref:cyclic nucleotide-gated ion channel 1-like n=1 Tax=Argentina anserina TaxID=57926 RepID=UPI0021763154|nr:cyclic nucleotide-gated ion channel 1-like [Potentilla anserina]